MGSPMVPFPANILMDFYESKWQNKYNFSKPKFYLRYIDDIVAASEEEQDSLNFLIILKKIHRNINFTREKQLNFSITFLDAFTSGINNQSLTLQIYQKSTYTDLLLKFKSFISFSYKISLIKCLVDNSFKICNNSNFFHNNRESIKYYLAKNAYPSLLIDKVIKKYFNYKFSSNQNDGSVAYYFKLPYIGNLLQHIKNKISKLCKEFCKVNFNIKQIHN